MKTQTYALLQRIYELVDQYVARKNLIKQLESLSDRELEDAGIVRGSINAYVQSIYSGKKSVEVDKPEGNRAISTVRLASNDRCHC